MQGYRREPTPDVREIAERLFKLTHYLAWQFDMINFEPESRDEGYDMMLQQHVRAAQQEASELLLRFYKPLGFAEPGLPWMTEQEYRKLVPSDSEAD